MTTVYAYVLKPVLFRCDPEFCHDLFTNMGRVIDSNPVTRGLTSLLFGYKHPALKQTYFGMQFDNPVGLAAGFDKNCYLPKLMKACGFGFEECGSITGEPCIGNAKPRLFRLPMSKSLVINYGLKNDGAEVVAKRIASHGKIGMPLGVSIARTNSEDMVGTDAGIRDFVKAHRHTASLGDYLTINISCPNAFGGESFATPTRLDLLLTELLKVKESKKPIFLKMALEYQGKDLDGIIDVAIKHKLHGLICCNLLKRRDHPALKDPPPLIPAKGGISGRATYDLSNEMISHVYKRTRKTGLDHEFLVIGVGGIFTAEHAYKKIRCGASLVQMITGMIYQGPQVVSEINRGLVELLKRDGFQSVSEAIGADHR